MVPVSDRGLQDSQLLLMITNESTVKCLWVLAEIILRINRIYLWAPHLAQKDKNERIINMFWVTELKTS